MFCMQTENRLMVHNVLLAWEKRMRTNKAWDPIELAFSYRKLRRDFKFYEWDCVFCWFSWNRCNYRQSSGWDVFFSLLAASWHLGLPCLCNDSAMTQLYATILGLYEFFMLDLLQSVRGLHYAPAMQLMRQSSEQVLWLTHWNFHMDTRNDNLKKHNSFQKWLFGDMLGIYAR